MKNILATVASFVFIQTLSTQPFARTTTPFLVQHDFYTKFPDSDVKKWMVRDNGLIAEFTKDRRKHFAFYSSDGEWRATESAIRRRRHLPGPVQQALADSGYKGWYVHNIKKIEMPGQRLYMLHLNSGSPAYVDKAVNFKADQVLYFSPGGQLVRKETI